MWGDCVKVVAKRIEGHAMLMHLMDLAAARRAELIAEVVEIDEFLDRAAELLDGRRPSRRSGAPEGSNVIPFPGPFSGARGGGTGASRSRRPEPAQAG